MESKIELLLDECKLIQENSAYNEQIHFLLAERKLTQSRWFTLLPAIVAAISGASIALGAPIWIGWLGAIAGIASAIANILDPTREVQEHTNTAKRFTVLKNDSRSLHEVHWQFASETELHESVKKLSERYNELLSSAPLMSNAPFMTFEQVFNFASKRILSGTQEPDFKQIRNKNSGQ
jgi:hypothetical protein